MPASEAPTRDGVSQRLRLLAAITMLLLGGAVAAQETQGDIRVNVKLVNVFATVTDGHGAPVANLTKDDFEVFEDGVAQKISVFEKQSELPVSLVLAVDASASVHKDLKLELESGRRFIATTLRKQDSASVYQFAQIVEELVPFTSDQRKVARGIKQVHVGSATALYDAIYLGGKALVDREGRKVMVIITDGGDTASKVSYHEALRAAQQSEALVYSIIIVPVETSAGRNTGGEHALIQLSRDTGGKYFYADSPAATEQALRQISEELRTQYQIAYYPLRRLSSSDFRQITVRVKGQAQANEEDDPHGYRVRYRAGYYTSKLE